MGFGNPLRRDDGVGWRVAEAVADRWAGRVTVRTGQQLLPEWALDLAEADVAFLIDACMTGSQVRLRRVIPASAQGLLDGHALGPAQLVQLVEAVYGRRPRTYVLQLPAQDFGFGEELSTLASAGVQHAIQLLDRRLAALLQRVGAE